MSDISSNRLAEARKSKGLTQQQLADRLGVHFVTISKLERGKMQLTADWITKLAEALEVTVPEIFSPPVLRQRIELEGVVQNGFSVRPVKGIESRYVMDSVDADDESSFWIAVADDAMAPFFHRGDALRFTLYHTEAQNIPEGRLACVRLEDGRHLVAITESQHGEDTFDIRTTSGQRMTNVKVEVFSLLSGAKIRDLGDD
ncbi:helix-turn-helix transcriptional regulator [Rhizobium pusense]|uniref:Helix-turn-helix transcriptional regulator n=1 Tax=Agrobacterium pusense TaxID=648995 RepID=A0A6H0ZSA2_9HYPH|nr:helix-turn-helix transcriptional regulator [Agrobacterium pusense]MDH2092080.1 helix-turn-helix transcriptional regulator [Agrobacterium pusense]QIX23712.1 helix-turn-helix transcriptional regulator [Agrobacterium pusense]WCK24132.1 helix-turn-helix transcriptional regulator [Agrobacterium pusense]